MPEHFTNRKRLSKKKKKKLYNSGRCALITNANKIVIRIYLAAVKTLSTHKPCLFGLYRPSPVKIREGTREQKKGSYQVGCGRIGRDKINNNH